MFEPAWSATGTKEHLEAYIGTGFVLRVGWIENGLDTVFVEQHSENYFTVRCWNETNTREKLLKALNQEVHRDTL